MERAKGRGPLGRLILDARKRRGYSQKELAKLADLEVSSLGAYERGKCNPRAEKLARICLALDLEPDAVCREILRAEVGELRHLVEQLKAERGIQEALNNQEPVVGQDKQDWDLACGIWNDRIVLTARLSRTRTVGEVADGMVHLVRKLLGNPCLSHSVLPFPTKARRSP
jgi:transcriptional regulator with XRE-family HTH domain